MKKWSYAKLMTSVLLFLFVIILLLAFHGGSTGDNHQYVHVAIGAKDSMGRKLKHLEPKTESLKMINPKKTNEFEYSDQVSNDLLEREVFFDTMATDYRGLKRRKPPINN
ncbi:hypothetical protein ARALYDRAFT_317104 [Arabidopsis lyrata subsp. lyrata]|uniref:Uncharacterized protein n=1 Tax=Arabidopsis lyrata subsp. lyrata TaxID=81972 RepID=D7KZE7_ARALL|nr:root meristem growth factor 7 [Arabidopsis lyrata subsp. lyrata]EFH58474.1 hypothetical protein ARALYDRAFT_317104 [Arabidopsis lyrata subsp. lyrata]|eukprot:XP_002882215.1 root meristem growth factor 7 [Arabidopsis lyrata subsp. lyrata]